MEIRSFFANFRAKFQRQDVIAILFGVGIVCFTSCCVHKGIVRRMRRRELAKLCLRKRKERDIRRMEFKRKLNLSFPRPEDEDVYTSMTATELLKAFKLRKIRCEDAMRAFCARALRLGELTNCITEEDYENV